jgi:hypothetical protein
MALLREQCGGHRRINPAGHGDNDAHPDLTPTYANHEVTKVTKNTQVPDGFLRVFVAFVVLKRS